MTSPTRVFFKPLDAVGTCSARGAKLTVELNPLNRDIGFLTVSGKDMRAVYQITDQTSLFETPFNHEKITTAFFKAAEDRFPLFSFEIELKGDCKLTISKKDTGEYTAVVERIAKAASPVFQQESIYPKLYRFLGSESKG